MFDIPRQPEDRERERLTDELNGIEAHLYHVENLMFRLLRERHRLHAQIAELDKRTGNLAS